VKADALREQIIVARGEGDKAKEAELYVKLAEFYDLSEYKTVCEYLLQAAKLFAACEDRKSSRECIEVALTFLFEKGKIKNETLCSEILQFTQNEQLCEVVRLWEAFGEDSGRNRGASGLSEPETDPAMHLDKLLSFIPEQESLVAKCLRDISLKVVESCGEALLIRAVESFSEKIRESVYGSICSAMEKNFQEDISKLMVDFLSPAATAKIEFYEKCFRFMNHFDNENLAAIAGNLALIFRRRNDKEKTVYYHEISGEKYKARGKTKDYLIETMNVATAYSAFGDMEKAIELLRTGMQEAGAAGEDLLQASMAGNLASMLSKRNLEHERQELLYCFSVEEAYFRSTENIRDLVISLLNQILYYRKAYTIKEWKPKLEEVGSLIRKYNLKEFVSVLSRLEWEASAMSKEQQHSEEVDVEKKLSDLLQDNESYVVEATEFQDGVYHCVCRPKDKVAMGAEELHLFYQPEEFCHLKVLGLFRPFMYAEQKAPEVKGYIDWWNKEAGEYSLALDEEKHVLRGNGTLSAANWETLRERLNTFLKLWSTDKINAVSLLLGLVDLPACQGAKLKALNGGI
ncbi:MAG: hypothetical protein IKM59_07895, partial [Oscillospiraceae bacterium]|nr:hypothetical protein [Oscillospiraceae bacterium]